MIKFDDGKTTQKKKDDQPNNKTMQLVAKWMIQKSAGDPEAKNTEYQILAEENKVTDLPSFINEIEYRWKGNPWLGGYNPTLEKIFNTPNPFVKPSPFKEFIKISKPTKKQQGGIMNNQEEMQKAFMAYLIEEATAQGMESEEQIRAYIEQLGQEGLKAKYQKFIKKMQSGRKAKLGTKLEYYNYLKKGGKTCCEQKGGNIPTTPVKKQNEVQKFKSNRKRLDPEKTPTLPGGKYPLYWTPDERIKWERKYGDKQEGSAAVEPLGKNR